MITGKILHRKSVIPQHLHPGKWGAYSLTSFDTIPQFTDGVLGYGSPTGTSANTGLFIQPCAVGGSLPVLYYQNGTQTIVAPTWTVNGLVISGDLTDTEGVNYNFGSGDNVARGKHVHTIGGTTSDGVPEAFFASATITAADVSGITSLVFGIRKTQAFQTAITGYTDLCCVGLVATNGNISVRTRLNNGTAVVTDTTLDWADGETKTLTVQVAQSGKARVTVIPGTIYSTSATTICTFPAFTFDASDTVHPFLDLLHATTSPGAITISRFESGFMMDNSVDVTV